MLSPLFAMAARRLPMKQCTNNFGVTIAVAKVKMAGCTLGNVDNAPFDSEYGSGQSRIMQSNLSPSCLRVRVKAANRLSLATRRSTYRFRRVLDTRKAKNDP